jgi:hypothetical protein
VPQRGSVTGIMQEQPAMRLKPLGTIPTSLTH